MSKQVQRGDTFNLPNTEAGRALLVRLMESHLHHSMAFRVSRETVEAAGRTFVLLTLEKLGKRPHEGVIAQGMKERRA